MEKISDIIESIANEKGLDIESVKERVVRAVIGTARRIYGAQNVYDAVVDANTKNIKLFQKVEVVAPDDERLVSAPTSVISLQNAKKEDASAEVGDSLSYELSLDNLGRTAASALHKELEFHIQRLVEEKIFEKYNQMVGNIVFGSVVRVDGEENTYIEIEEIRAVLPRKYRIKGEKIQSRRRGKSGN